MRDKEMFEIRKSITRKVVKSYKDRPIIRVINDKGKFIVSKCLTNKLGIDVENEGLMFGVRDKKLHVYKEPKESDNYHLGLGESNTYRFKSIELEEFLLDFFNHKFKTDFFIEMQDDFSFTKVKIAE